MLIDGIQLRPADREEIEDDPKYQAAVIEPEGPTPDLFSERMRIGCDVAQAEIDQPDAEETEGAKQRGVGMVKGQERSMLIVVHQRGVERAATEDAGADEIPEGGADDVAVGKPIFELAM